MVRSGLSELVLMETPDTGITRGKEAFERVDEKLPACVHLGLTANK